MKTIAFLTLLMIAAHSRAETVIDVGDNVLRSDVKRFGIGLAQHNYYDSNQMMKELLFRNPGFEGLLFQSVVRLGGGGQADTPSGFDTVIEEVPYTQWRTGFWNGANFEIVWSTTPTAKGRTGSIVASLAPEQHDPAGSAQGTTYTLSPSIPVRMPASGDYIQMRKVHLGGTAGGAAYASWETVLSNNGIVDSEHVDLPPADPLPAQPVAIPVPPNQQCARLSALTQGASATILGRFDPLEGFIRFNGHYRVAFKAKGTGGTRHVRVVVRRWGVNPYLDRIITLPETWSNQTLSFPDASSAPLVESETISGPVTVEFSTIGQCAFLLDDVSLRQTDSREDNPTEFRDAVVDAIKGLRPGILRYVNWQDVGNSLDNSLAPVFVRKRSAYNTIALSENNMMPGLHEFFVLARHVGADPWYSIPVTFSPQEVSNLMEYLGGPNTTPYGALRAARGQAQPWTEIFPRIHLEFGNENWNPGFRGAIYGYGPACGQRASEFFQAVKSSPYYQSSRFQCILGGQSGNPGVSLPVHNASSQHDVMAFAPYMSAQITRWRTPEGGIDSNTLFSALFAEPQWWSMPASPTPQTANPMVGLLRQNYLNIQSSARPVPIVIYEVNLHTTEFNPNSTDPLITQEALDSYTPSVGAGIAVMTHMLTMLRELGARDQCFFSLAGHRTAFGVDTGLRSALWGAVLDMGKTNRKRPHYHALQMTNDALGGELLRTTQSGDNPTWSVDNINRVTYGAANHIHSFAFREGPRRALVLFNLHRSDALDVRFTGPNAPAGNLTLRRLTSANITDNNENADIVVPTSQALVNFDPAQALPLPPFSMTLLQWEPPARQAWRFEHFGTVAATGSAADDADPDGDNLTNILEYAMGTLPRQASPPPWTASTAGGYLGISVPKNTAASGLTWSAESSDDLTNWHPEQTEVLMENTTTFSARDTVPMNSAAKRFIRLRVTASP